MSTHGNEPQYGQRLSPEELAARAAPRPAPAPPISPLAARRMARGLSFTLVLLGVLLGAGLTATGLAWGWAAGIVPVLLGAAGFIGVQAGLHRAFRDPGAPGVHHRSRLWLIPAALLALGLGSLGAVFAVEPALAGTPSADRVAEYVSVLVVSGMTLVVAAGLGFGLVAVASFTPRDDDDSPLRPTGYAQRSRPHRGGRDYYDSQWVHRRPHYGRDGDTPDDGRPDAPGD